VPVKVWKHVRRKRSVSRISMPVFGREGLGRDQWDEGVVAVVGVEVVEAPEALLAGTEEGM
jgi:hypothetical protein